MRSFNPQEQARNAQREVLEQELADFNFTNWGKDKLDKTLAEVNRYLQKEYERFGIPAEDALFEYKDNYDTVEQAQKDAIRARTLLSGVDDRNRSRYGITARNQGEAAYNERARTLATMTARADAVNNARRSDRDFRLESLQDLLNQGAGLRNNAVQGLGNAAQNEQSREANNRAARSAKRGQDMQMAGTVAGLGLMAAMMM